MEDAQFEDAVSYAACISAVTVPQAKQSQGNASTSDVISEIG